ncbi:CocE/NonD family hydrolase [Streptomyces nodosus]|uniref:CocE/NonD family hydrolase n=1 Tax=Streptomyces nodosus TaxID=40318 RepID=UPI000A41CC33|nr:CocE/NonD family hydrolase [Streptomyces nodosus]MBB4789840.1 putative CocE/NonD family hydrolase [Streptomyces nodosus]
MAPSYTLEIDAQIPVRDGTRLSANIWRPRHEEPVPVILIRTPYGKDDSQLIYSSDPNMYSFLEAGYAIVRQETRGTFHSEDMFYPYAGDGEDGADTIRWLREQPWCNGDVGMWGQSYMGMVQWAVAATGVEGLKAIATAQASADFYRAHWYSPGGAMSLDTSLCWVSLIVFNKLRRDLADGDLSVLSDLEEVARILASGSALTEVLPTSYHPVLHRHAPWLAEVFAHPSRDDYWKAYSPLERLERVEVPALSIAGWYDTFLTETLRAHTGMRSRAAHADARDGQRLIIGPWGHAPEFVTGDFPDRQFGPAAGMRYADLTTAHRAFLDHWVKGDTTALDGIPPVRIFVMGIDQWRDETAWPLPDTAYTDFHLSADGPANTAAGGGTLALSPAPAEQRDSYLYNPLRPVPSVGGAILALDQTVHAGPSDQSTVEAREDVLCFTGPVLDEPIEVTGHVSVTLHVSSSARDTDFTGKLVDVHPDGRAILLCEGIQRMRYRESLEAPRLMEPGTVYEVTIEMAATSNVFLPGHRIRLEVSSSNFPRYDRNTNTGGEISAESAADMVSAVNTVHHGPEHPSSLTLPVIRR